MEQYINPEEQDDLKGMLYSYLKDKAQRRAGITSKADYEGAEDIFAKQMKLRDTGALLGGLSEAASMAGQLQGKRAESDIIPKVNQDLYSTTQGAYENFRTLRDQEERSNMNDLNVARYLTDIDRQKFEQDKYKDLEPRRALELKLMEKKAAAEAANKRRFEPRLTGPGGRPVVLDQEGNPTELPTGFSINQKMASEDPYADLKRKKLEGEIEKDKAQTESIRNRPKQISLTPGQKTLDQAFAKDYSDYVAAGGYSDVQKSIEQLKESRQKLASSKSVSGPFLGLVPESIESKVNPQATDIRESIAEVVQRNLRLVLGAQFTEKEGAALINRAYNRSLPEEQNLRRLDRLLLQIQRAAEAKQRAIEYFEENGTLQGFKGKLPSMADIASGLDAETSPGTKKSVTNKQYSPSRDQTRITYSDGTVEVVNGRQ